MTISNRSLLTGVGLVALCAVAANTWVAISIHGLKSEFESWRRDVHAQMLTIGTGDNISQDATEPEPEIQFKTDADAVSQISTLKDTSDAEDYAKVISEVDGWLVKPEDEEKVQERIAEMLPRLRELVTKEVDDLQKEALITLPSAEGARKLDNAGRILALYPMSTDRGVTKEATRLLDQQKDAATRLDVLRRQRYNRWAIDQIERAINYFNENVSRWNPLKDNTALIDPLVTDLGSIDPMLLEPAVLELYSYIIDRTKGSLSENDTLELAKRLTDPDIQRMTTDDL